MYTMPYKLGLPSCRINLGQRYTFLWSGIFLLCYMITTVISFPPYDNDMIDIYAKLASDEVYSPDQYAFNVSCINCF